MTDANLNDLDPVLLKMYRQWLIECYAIPIAVKAIVTWRSPTDQNLAKAKGLSNAAAGESPHNCCTPDGLPSSKAFDFAVFDDDGKYITDGTDERYTQAGEIAEQLGLEWGGRWKHPDYDHIELADWKTTA